MGPDLLAPQLVFRFAGAGEAGLQDSHARRKRASVVAPEIGACSVSPRDGVSRPIDQRNRRHRSLLVDVWDRRKDVRLSHEDAIRITMDPDICGSGGHDRNYYPEPAYQDVSTSYCERPPSAGAVEIRRSVERVGRDRPRDGGRSRGAKTIRVDDHEAYPINVTFRPAGVAAVVLVFSLASMVSLVDRIVVPPSLMSTVRTEPVGAVVTLARTAVSVKA